jgi:hypothetical protein
MNKNNTILPIEEILQYYEIEKRRLSEIKDLQEDEYFLIIDAMSYSTPFPHQNFVLMKWLGKCEEEKSKRLCLAEQDHFNNYCRRFLQYTEKRLNYKNYGMFSLYENSLFSGDICVLAPEGKEIKIEKMPPRNFETIQAQWLDFRIIGIPPLIYFGRFFNLLTIPIFEFFLFYFPVKRAFVGGIFIESYMKIPCVLRKHEKIAQGIPLCLN